MTYKEEIYGLIDNYNKSKNVEIRLYSKKMNKRLILVFDEESEHLNYYQKIKNGGLDEQEKITRVEDIAKLINWLSEE